MWALAKLLFSGALEWLLKALSAAAEWLFADWRNAPLAIFGVAVFWMSFVTVPGLNADVADQTARANRAEIEREATMDAFEQTVANYLAAAAEAQAIADANVARVRAEQAVINQETINVYQSRLGAVRARADELRRAAESAAATNPGGAVQPGMPGSGAASGPAAATPADPRLPARSCAPGFVCLTIDEAEIASAQAVQLDALIDWVLRQGNVRFNLQEVPDDER